MKLKEEILADLWAKYNESVAVVLDSDFVDKVMLEAMEEYADQYKTEGVAKTGYNPDDFVRIQLGYSCKGCCFMGGDDGCMVARDSNFICSGLIYKRKDDK